MKLTDKKVIKAIKDGKELYRAHQGRGTKYHIRETRTGLEAFIRDGCTDFIVTININWLEADDWEVISDESVAIRL